MTCRYTGPLLALLLAAGCTQADEANSPAPSPQDPATVANNTPFAWPSFDEAIATGKRQGKPILIDIYAPWCGWCARMQQEVYGNATLAAFVHHNFSHGRLNIDDAETTHSFMGYTLTSQELGYAFGATGTPTTVFLTYEGVYITRMDGYMALEPFGKVLQHIASGAYQAGTPESFETAHDRATSL